MAMRKGLGKGLGALIGDYNEQPDAPSEGAVTLPLQKIEPNPLQPRKTFNPEELDSLADSIRMHGIIQPLTVWFLLSDRHFRKGTRGSRGKSLHGGFQSAASFPDWSKYADDLSGIRFVSGDSERELGGGR